MFLTFTQWNRTIPFTIVARNGGNPDSLISTIAVKPYRASVSEISIHLQAMFWIRGFSTWCYEGQYSSPMLYTIKCFYYRHYGESKVMYFIKSILNNGMQEEVSQFFAQDWYHVFTFAAFSIEAKKYHRKSSQNDYYEIFYKYYEMFYKCV